MPQVTRGAPSIIFRDDAEAAAYADQCAQALRLGWGLRQAEPPLLFKTVSQDLAATYGAARGRTDAQVSARRGPIEAAPGQIAEASEQPDTLSTELAARLADVHPRTMRKWIAGGLVEARRGPRGALLVDVASLAMLLSGSRTANEE